MSFTVVETNRCVAVKGLMVHYSCSFRRLHVVLSEKCTSDCEFKVHSSSAAAAEDKARRGKMYNVHSKTVLIQSTWSQWLGTTVELQGLVD